MDADSLIHVARPDDSTDRVYPISMGRYGPTVAIPRILETYRRLGVQLEPESHPSARNLRNLSRGLVDGDVAISDILARPYPNLIAVEPALLESVFVLLCFHRRKCHPSVLFADYETVLCTDSGRAALTAQYPEALKANLYPINHLDTLPKMINSGRVLAQVLKEAAVRPAVKDKPLQDE